MAKKSDPSLCSSRNVHIKLTHEITLRIPSEYFRGFFMVLCLGAHSRDSSPLLPKERLKKTKNETTKENISHTHTGILPGK